MYLARVTSSIHDTGARSITNELVLPSQVPNNTELQSASPYLPVKSRSVQPVLLSRPPPRNLHNKPPKYSIFKKTTGESLAVAWCVV